MSKLSILFPLPKSLWEFFQSWLTIYSNSLFSCLWYIIPALVIWAIWWERNKRIFKKLSSDIPSILNTIEWLISEQVNSRSSLHFNPNETFTSWYSSVIAKWKYISPPYSPIFPCIRKSLVCRSNVKWIPPKPSLIKLNFDGSSRGNLSESGIGCCLRNQSGKVVALLERSICPCTNNMVEAIALLEGLKLEKKMLI